MPLPLQLDSSDPAAIEAAARAYAGRPMVNSVNGKADNLATVLPVVARYGCTVVGLTLDENGIPPTAEERLAIAERIVAAAEAHGIPREDVAIDCLVMAAATNQDEVREILRAVTLVKERLGVRTVLGVSNVSFGLPARPLVNSTFLAAAFGAGLDMPILNPLNVRYRDTVATFRILNAERPFGSLCSPQATREEAEPAETAVAEEATEVCAGTETDATAGSGRTSMSARRAAIWSGVVPQQPPTTVAPASMIASMAWANSLGPTSKTVSPS